jgi:hypothetical protein
MIEIVASVMVRAMSECFMVGLRRKIKKGFTDSRVRGVKGLSFLGLLSLLG